MPPPERKYVRVYYSIINDERFADVYHDARKLGTWLQLLLVADAMHPADAPLPAYVHRPSMDALVLCGLVEHRPHQHFRIHGLDSERGMRAQSARNASAVRWQSERNPSGFDKEMPRQAETSIDKTSRDEQAQEMRPHLEDLDGPVAYYELTGKYPVHGSPLHDWTTRLAEEYGPADFQKALATEYTISRKPADLLSRTEARLAMAVDGERAAADRERSRAEAEATMRLLEEQRARQERIAATPPKPLSELMPDVKFRGKAQA